MNRVCKFYLFKLIKEADQFGSVFRPMVNQGQQELKTIIGGIFSIIIYGLSLAYFIYGIQLWTTNQILPTITEFNEVIDYIQYQSQEKIVLIQPVVYAGKLDPFDQKSIILMLMIQQYQNGISSSGMTRLKSVDSSFIIENVELIIDNINQTDQVYFLFLTTCQQDHLTEFEQCASEETIKEFWSTANMMEIQLYSQKFNPQLRQLQQLNRQYFILYDQSSTYALNLQMLTTISNTDEGILFPSIQQKRFVSDILQYSQTTSIQQFSKEYEIQIYLGINLRMDTQQSQLNIAYPKLSQVLANIGSIISTLMLLSYVSLYINQNIHQHQAKFEIIRIFYPEIGRIDINKNWYGRIISIKDKKNSQNYNIEKFKQYYSRLCDVAEQKLCLTNQIYEISRLQFAMQQLLSKEDIFRLRDKHLNLSLKPEVPKQTLQTLNQTQILPANESKELKTGDVQDLADNQVVEQQNQLGLQNQEQVIDQFNDIELQFNEDDLDFDLLCQNRKGNH